MNIHVRIERLVLEGLPVTNSGAAHVQAALERHIQEALEFSALPRELQQDGASNLKTADMRVDSTDTPSEVGRRISHAVCRSLALQPAPADAGSHQDTQRGTRR